MPNKVTDFRKRRSLFFGGFDRATRYYSAAAKLKSFPEGLDEPLDRSEGTGLKSKLLNRRNERKYKKQQELARREAQKCTDSCLMIFVHLGWVLKNPRGNETKQLKQAKPALAKLRENPIALISFITTWLTEGKYQEDHFEHKRHIQADWKESSYDAVTLAVTMIIQSLTSYEYVSELEKTLNKEFSLQKEKEDALTQLTEKLASALKPKLPNGDDDPIQQQLITKQLEAQQLIQEETIASIANYRNRKQEFTHRTGQILAFLFAIGCSLSAVPTLAAMPLAVAIGGASAAIIGVSVATTTIIETTLYTLATTMVANLYIHGKSVPNCLINIFGKGSFLKGYFSHYDNTKGKMVELSSRKKGALIGFGIFGSFTAGTIFAALSLHGALALTFLPATACLVIGCILAPVTLITMIAFTMRSISQLLQTENIWAMIKNYCSENRSQKILLPFLILLGLFGMGATLLAGVTNLLALPIFASFTPVIYAFFGLAFTGITPLIIDTIVKFHDGVLIPSLKNIKRFFTDATYRKKAWNDIKNTPLRTVLKRLCLFILNPFNNGSIASTVSSFAVVPAATNSSAAAAYSQTKTSKVDIVEKLHKSVLEQVQSSTSSIATALTESAATTELAAQLADVVGIESALEQVQSSTSGIAAALIAAPAATNPEQPAAPPLADADTAAAHEHAVFNEQWDLITPPTTRSQSPASSRGTTPPTAEVPADPDVIKQQSATLVSA